MKNTEEAIARDLEEECEVCGGAGMVRIGENLVTMDMAIDAVDRSLQGNHYSYEDRVCDNCCGIGKVIIPTEQIQSQLKETIKNLEENN